MELVCHIEQQLGIVGRRQNDIERRPSAGLRELERMLVAIDREIVAGTTNPVIAIPIPS
jgi:hypothetical protein